MDSEGITGDSGIVAPLVPTTDPTLEELQQAAGAEILEGMIASLLLPLMMKNVTRAREFSKE